MHIRNKPNKGGSISVLLMESERAPGKKHPFSRVVKNFGACYSPEEIAQKRQEAERYKAGLLSKNISKKPLTIKSGSDIRAAKSVNIGFTNVYGSMFTKLFHNIGLSASQLKKLHDLVCMRIAMPASKRRTAHCSQDFSCNLKQEAIYKFMDLLTEPIIEKIQQIIFNNTQEIVAATGKEVDVLCYDLTTIYFENNTQDALRNFGFSKDGKHMHVQITMALVVTKEGLPIGYELFPGNSYEGHTLIPCLESMRKKYQIRRVILVADAALMNNINLKTLDEKGFEYVISARIKNSKADIKNKILTEEKYVLLGKRPSTITGHLAAESTAEEPEDIIKAQVIKVEDGGYNLISYFSTARARKDAYDRNKNLEKIVKYLDSSAKSKLTGALKKSYVKMTRGSKIEIDPIKLAKDELFDGYFGLCTNIQDPRPEELLSYYRGLWQVEQAFRISKHNLAIRPVYHYSERRIRAHFIICYIALALIRFTEFKLKTAKAHMPTEQLHRLLNQVKLINITTADGELYQLLEDLPDNAVEIYKTLHLKLPKRFTLASPT